MKNISYIIALLFTLSSTALFAGVTVIIEDVDPINPDGTRTVRVKYMSDGTDYNTADGSDDWGSQTLTFGFTPPSGAAAGAGDIAINDAGGAFDWNGGFSANNTPNMFMLMALGGTDDGNFYFTVTAAAMADVAIAPGEMVVALEFTIPGTWSGDGAGGAGATSGQIFLLENQDPAIMVNLEPTLNNGGTAANEWDGGAATSDVPVDLVSFNAKANNNFIALDWSSASEINTDRFEIGRSTDGKDFEKIASVDAAGSSLETLEYAYKDLAVKTGIVYYYQLKMVDFDGTVEYSEISTAVISAKDRIVSLYPNPATEQVSISVDASVDDEAQITIYDASGKAVYERVQVLNEGINILNFNIAGISAGLYRVVISGQQIRVMENVVIMD